MDLASIYFGLFLGVFVFTFAKVLHQTRLIWRRTRSFTNIYLYMIWVEAWVNFVFALITFLYLNRVIPGGLGFYLLTVTLWAIQTQLLPQIIANRVSLVMTNKRKARNLKWGLAVSIACVNIAVYYIWTVAHLESATPFQQYINYVFEKFEKSFFLILDLGLNLYFLYLVRFRLISEGLTKYWRLFNFNAGIVFLSTSMDALLLGFLSLPDPFLYVQFSPLAYIVKLHIELLMAVLISKVVRGSTVGRGDDWNESSGPRSNGAHHTLTSRVVVKGGPAVSKPDHAILSKLAKTTPYHEDNSGSETQLTTFTGENGIIRTVETTIVVDDIEDDCGDKLHG